MFRIRDSMRIRYPIPWSPTIISAANKKIMAGPICKRIFSITQGRILFPNHFPKDLRIGSAQRIGLVDGIIRDAFLNRLVDRLGHGEKDSQGYHRGKHFLIGPHQDNIDGIMAVGGILDMNEMTGNSGASIQRYDPIAIPTTIDRITPVDNPKKSRQ